ncbi:MAG: C40 family peptidase [Lachnospiraceae bacterium]|nr:C40 family peptidase [Lachnospiraceae bacterium]
MKKYTSILAAAACGLCLLAIPGREILAASESTYFETIVVIEEETDAVSLHSETDENSKTVGQISFGEIWELQGEIRVTNSEGTSLWYRVVGEDEEGYVPAESVLTGSAAEEYLLEEDLLYAAALDENPAAVYLEADDSGVIVYQLQEGDSCLVTAVEGEYAVIEAENDFTGYARLDELSLTMEEPVVRTRESLVATALQYVGNPYVWGGTSLTEGVDCSGFTMKIYEKYGISLPHSSAAQSKMGTKVSSSDLEPGDLIFYGSGKTVNHVAIYIGDGKVVHAATEKTGIRISDWDYKTPITIRRLLE